jgi:glycosyltransferase involved in cell wall biosynthesis
MSTLSFELPLAPPAAAPVAGSERAALPRLGAIVLTFNCAPVIERTLRAALRVAERVVVVDSFSSDSTVEIARRLGCEVVQRAFVNYAEQRNWAIDEFGARSQWQLHLDADEVLDALACSEIRRVLSQPGDTPQAYIFKRRTYFLDRPLRFGGASNFHLRLFRSGTARCENRLYDQHFVSPLPGVRLRGLMHDMNVGSLTEWSARHNRWSDMEAAELGARESGRAEGQLHGRLSADPRERRRLYKSGYYAAPPVLRVLALFVYRYVLLGGFLDGRAGFYYAFFQVLWFRMLVDAKLHEAGAAAKP